MTKIREKSNKNDQIDLYQALRIILEFYILEKEYKLFKLKEDFIECARNTGSQERRSRTLDFKHFNKFVEKNFPTAKEQQIVRCYRKAWSLLASDVTYESFVCAAVEEGLFLQEIRVGSDNPPENVLTIHNLRNKQFYGTHKGAISQLISNQEYKFGWLKEIIVSNGNIILQEKFKDFEKFQKNNMTQNNRETAFYQGDLISYITNFMVDLVKMIDCHKLVNIQFLSTKNLPYHDQEMLDKINVFFVRIISSFMTGTNEVVYEVKNKYDIAKVEKLQKWFRRENLRAIFRNINYKLNLSKPELTHCAN